MDRVSAVWARSFEVDAAGSNQAGDAGGSWWLHVGGCLLSCPRRYRGHGEQGFPWPELPMSEDSSVQYRQTSTRHPGKLPSSTNVVPVRAPAPVECDVTHATICISKAAHSPESFLGRLFPVAGATLRAWQVPGTT